MWGGWRAGWLAVPLALAPAARGAGPSLSTKAELEWAIETGSGRAQKLELQVEPQLDLGLPEGFDLTAIGRLRADAYDRLAPGGAQQAEIWTPTRRLELGDRVELELRELYLEGKVGSAWLRMGKQQVVWGQADGLKVLDVVDPQDFREFILPDFDESRIPLWTANLEVPIGPTSLQLLWIPDPTVHDLPRRDAVFAFRSPQLIGPPAPSGLPVHIDAPDHPSGLDASDAGARLAGRWRGWDLTANYLYHYDDVPVLRRSLAFRPSGPIGVVDPDYERAHVVGGTASNAFGQLTVRGELAYTTPRWFPSQDDEDPDGVVEADEIGAVLGLDWYGFEDALVSLQVFPSWIPDSAPGLIRDRVDVNLTLLGRRTFRNEALIVEAIWLHNLNQGDGLVRPQVRYELRDELWVWAGLDWFYGTEDGIFGEFDARDRAVVGFEVGF
jgi:hypothetical protein